MYPIIIIHVLFLSQLFISLSLSKSSTYLFLSQKATKQSQKHLKNTHCDKKFASKRGFLVTHTASAAIPLFALLLASASFSSSRSAQQSRGQHPADIVIDPLNSATITHDDSLISPIWYVLLPLLSPFMEPSSSNRITI